MCVGGGMLEVWAGRPRQAAPARPPGLCVPPSAAPSPGAARFTAQETRAPSHRPPPRDPFPTETERPGAAGRRCPVNRGSGKIRAEERCHRAGAELQPLLRTGQSCRPAAGRSGWPSTASPCGSRPEAAGGQGTLQCRPGERGSPAVGTCRTGKAPASPASPGHGRLHPPPAPATPAPKKATRKIKWWERGKAPWKG